MLMLVYNIAVEVDITLLCVGWRLIQIIYIWAFDIAADRYSATEIGIFTSMQKWILLWIPWTALEIVDKYDPTPKMGRRVNNEVKIKLIQFIHLAHRLDWWKIVIKSSKCSRVTLLGLHKRATALSGATHTSQA